MTKEQVLYHKLTNLFKIAVIDVQNDRSLLAAVSHLIQKMSIITACSMFQRVEFPFFFQRQQ